MECVESHRSSDRRMLYGRGSQDRKRGVGMDLSTRRAYIRGRADTSDLTYELLKRMHAEFGDFRRDLASIKMRLGSVEQQQASVASDIARISGDIARINVELDAIRDDVSRIKRRLDLAEA